MKNHTLSMLQQDLSQFSQEELSRSASQLHRPPAAQSSTCRTNLPQLRPLTRSSTYERTGPSVSPSPAMFGTRPVAGPTCRGETGWGWDGFTAVSAQASLR